MAIDEEQGVSQKAEGADSAGGAVAPVYPSGQCTFSAEWGTLSVQVRADGMEATLLAVVPAPGEVTLGEEEITALLLDQHIVSGLLPENIRQVVAELAGGAGWSGRMVVAEGRPPGVPGGLDHVAFGPEAEVLVTGPDIWQVNGRPLAFAPLQNFFQQNRCPGEDPTFVAKALMAGEPVAVRRDPLTGRPGRDIFGRQLKAPDFCELVAGDNITLVGLRRFTAALFGYMLVSSRRLSVVSPIVVADHGMTAWYVNLPQFSPQRQPSVAEVRALLTRAGVRHGMMEAAIAELCAALAQGGAPVWNKVAVGTPAVPGEDGYLEFSVDRSEVAGTLRQDGSMDMRALNMIQTVDEGERIAVLHPPTAGQKGYSITGQELETTAGEELKVEARDNVRLEEIDTATGRALGFFAVLSGIVHFKNQTLTVDPLYLVKGNVDFSTGNIEVDCDLHIQGSICADFIVKSTKNVLVGGSIEAGAKVFVEGDLEVKAGIFGESTDVRVLGNLQAGYIQAAKVVVKGEIRVRQYIFASTVRSIGAIVVGPGSGGRGGSITGGVVTSCVSITAKSSGSPSNVPTILSLEPHPKQLAASKSLKRAIIACQARLQMIKETLKMESLDLQVLQKRCQQAPPGQARVILGKLLGEIKNTIGKMDELTTDREAVKKTIRNDAALMSISITHHCYGNTLIRILRKELLDLNDRGPAVFVYKEGGVVVAAGKGAGEAAGRDGV